MKAFLWQVLINALLFAVLGYLLNLLPFLQTRVVRNWADAQAVLVSHALTGAIFGVVWHFLGPRVERRQKERGTND